MSTELPDWDARSYDDLPLPHVDWAEALLDRADIRRSESAVDAGCGTGRDLGSLVDRRSGQQADGPPGQLYGVDVSPAMIEQARSRLESLREDRPLLHLGSILDPWPVIAPVDVVFSVAALHWVPDHRQVFRRAAEALRTGGRFIAECGGEGNIAEVIAAVGHVAPEFALPDWNFAGTDATAARLRAAGFEPVELRLRPWPVALADINQCRRFLHTIVLRGLADDHVRAVAERLEDFTVDYVRLEWTAVKTG